MRRKEMREVDATYCDICGDDITRQNCYGAVDAHGKETDICGNSNGWKSGTLNCYEKFKQKRSIESGDICLS